VTDDIAAVTISAMYLLFPGIGKVTICFSFIACGRDQSPARSEAWRRGELRTEAGSVGSKFNR